ncbi:MAG: class II fructose-bisphosphate aldolase [Lachnospiraceae bacterium]|nr:class II fructose-bisphosphate aldolase [Lachnospiraceae bacterium]
MLVTMKEILDRANEDNYAVAAPNINTELDTRACIEAAEELHAPIILDVNNKSNPDISLLGHIAAELAYQSPVPIAINLDHGGEMSHTIKAFKGQFTSIMVDRSTLPYEENVRETKLAVEMAHSIGISVEAELGHVGQGNNYAHDGVNALTDPKEAARFIKETGVDCLAVAIGTAHGAYAGTPHIDFERLIAIKEATGHFPLVLHGGSGTGDENLAKACTLGINKVNLSNDLAKGACQAAKAYDFTGNKAYDLWKVLKGGYKAALIEKMKLFGCEGKAWSEPPKGLTVAEITGREN